MNICHKYLVAAIWLVAGCSPLAAGQCDSEPDKGVVDRRSGHDTRVIPFDFESRVQKFSKTAYEYVWCIENKSDRVPGFFKWGTTAEDDRYLSNFVIPNSPTIVRATDSRGTSIDTRVLKVRASDSDQWIPIHPQTIIIRGTERVQPLWGGRNNAFTIQRTQSDLESQLSQFRTESGLIDLVKLSTNHPLMSAFVQREKRIEFVFSSLVAVPTTAEALKALESHSYKTYDAKDFVRLSIRLVSKIEHNEKGVPIATIALMVDPVNKDELGRLKEVANLPIEVSLSPMKVSADRYPKELSLKTRIYPEFNKTLTAQPSFGLLPADTILSMSSGNLSFVRMTISLLFPLQRV